MIYLGEDQEDNQRRDGMRILITRTGLCCTVPFIEHTSIDACLWRASLLRRIVDGALAFLWELFRTESSFVSSGHLETKEGTGMP